MFEFILALLWYSTRSPVLQSQPTVARSLSPEAHNLKTNPPPASALDAIRRARQYDPVPVSALSALTVVPPKLPPVTAEVAEILERWETASRDVKTSQFDLRRTIYNLVFETEQRYEGELCFESPDKVSFVLRPAIIPKGMKGARIAKNGSPFRLESGHSESWIWTADELATANDEEQTYERFRVVPPSRFYFTPSIFFEGSAEKLREAFDISISSRRDDRIVLKAVPRTIALKRMFGEWVLLMDSNTFQFTAAKYFDPAGNLEVVYKLENGMINQSLPADCFDPALKWPGYREVKLD